VSGKDSAAAGDAGGVKLYEEEVPRKTLG
jgi:hypothetical protein